MCIGHGWTWYSYRTSSDRGKGGSKATVAPPRGQTPHGRLWQSHSLHCLHAGTNVVESHRVVRCCQMSVYVSCISVWFLRGVQWSAHTRDASEIVRMFCCASDFSVYSTVSRWFPVSGKSWRRFGWLCTITAAGHEHARLLEEHSDLQSMVVYVVFAHAFWSTGAGVSY